MIEMTDQPPTTDDDQDYLYDLLDRALELIENGASPDFEVLLAGHEQLRDRAIEMVRLATRVAATRVQGSPAVPGYAIIGELGTGGMGVVYLARQERLGGRPVALKVLPPATQLSERARRRFTGEALAIGRLQHPNIVSIYDVVNQHDVLAYAMEWIDGYSLAQVIRETATAGDGPDIAAMARLGASIARALAAVHRAGLVHRDVKPSNILVRADGVPLLSDFGLVREADSTLTQPGQFAGTVAYAAPEQLRGAHDSVDPRSDIYSLGITLYHALALRPPFGADNPVDMLYELDRGPRATLRRLNRRVPRDLETIVMKAMEPDPAHRYQTADELAEDLDRFLSFQPIRAHRAGAFARLAKLVRRNRSTAWGLALGSVASLGVAAAIAIYVFLVPGWVAGHAAEARLALLDPEQANSIYLTVFWGLERDDPRRPGRLDNAALTTALSHYDSALRLAPFNAELRREREIVGEARDATTNTASTAPAGDPADRRSIGLRAYLAGDIDSALKAWEQYETAQDAARQPDAFVEAALGLLYLIDGQPARAYPRLRDAVQAFPEVGFLNVYLADAAIQCGDLAAARVLLDQARALARQDQQLAADRVRADLLAAEGHDDEALTLWMTIGSPVARFHRARLLEMRGRWAEAVEDYQAVAGRVPHGRMAAEAFTRAADRWWASLAPNARIRRIRHSLDDSTAGDSSFFVLLRVYSQAKKRIDEAPHRNLSAAGTPAGRKVIRRRANAVFGLSSLSSTFADAIRSAPLSGLSLSELAERMEVENMSLWSRIHAYPRVLKELQFAAWRWPTLRHAFPARLQIAVAAVLAFSIGTNDQARGQTVPGFVVQQYSTAENPFQLSFDAAGALFTGREFNNSNQGGSSIPTFILRIAPGGGPAIQFGPATLHDPDAVAVDISGTISGTPGSILVGGFNEVTQQGTVAVVYPNATAATLFASTGYENIAEMKFDHAGRLLFSSGSFNAAPQGIFVSAGGPPTLLASQSPPPLSFAVDSQDMIYTSTSADGIIRKYASNGTLLNGSFATGVSGWLEFGPGGAWGTDLYCLNSADGVLYRIDAQGALTQVGSGFPTGGATEDMAFGPDGAMYVSDWAGDRILRISPACTTPPCFQGLGDLPGGSTESYALGISADGTTVVGAGKSTASGIYTEGFRWHAATGMIALGDLPGNSYMSLANDVSSDGSVIVGWSSSGNGTRADTNYAEAFRWTEAGGMVGLGDAPDGQFCSEAYCVSSDGNTVGGHTHPANSIERATIWTNGSGWGPSVDNTPNRYSVLYDISPNGQWAVGRISSPLEAIRWSAVTGFQIIGDLPGGGTEALAFSVSQDGTTVVGYGTSASGQEAFRWTAAGGMTGLGDLPGGTFGSSASKISPDGTLIVGNGHSAVGLEAAIWNESLVISRLADVLTATGVSIPGGWTLTAARDITVINNVVSICGYGTNPSGQTEAWIARYALPPACDPAHVSQNPQNANPAPGATAHLTVAATGTATLSYQWRKNTVPLNNGPSGCSSTISGATTATLTITNVSTTDNATYDCVVTNTCGSATSDPATLTIPAGAANPGDMNNDGQVNGADVQGFVSALLSP